jgi:hypothetical protein
MQARDQTGWVAGRKTGCDGHTPVTTEAGLAAC